MVIGILVPAAILGLRVVGAAMLFRRGGDALDFAPRNLLRLYLYIASLAGIIVLSIGLSGILSAGLAATLGTGFVYGSNSFPVPAMAPACPLVPPPTTFNPALPAPIDTVMVRALAKNPRDRYESAGELMGALEAAARGASPRVVALIAGHHEGPRTPDAALLARADREALP